ncbi:MAG: IclR family transcriptional regulator C-terminal domain-containing protein [Burkholderiaceae bacterium]
MLAEIPISRATLYRHVQRLCGAGFLASAGTSGFRLGPRIIELDRQMRAADPLLIHGKGVLSQLISSFSGVLLLCPHYGDRVLCIHQETTDAEIHSSMERGRPFSLYYGAPSKVILANLPLHQQRRLLLDQGPQIREAGLGESWPQFRGHLKAIRAKGVYVAHGEIDPTLIGVGSPVFSGTSRVAGSLAAVVKKRGCKPATIDALEQMVRRGAALISERIGNAG